MPRQQRVFACIMLVLIFTEGYSQTVNETDSSFLKKKTQVYLANNLDSTAGFDSTHRPPLAIDTPEVISIKTPQKPALALPQVRPLLRSSGQITSENHYATLQNPFMRSAQVYSRLTYSGNIFVAGLPFQTNTFLTTENNSIYRSNYINIRFDAQAYQKQLRHEAEKQSKSLSKTVSFNGIVLQQLRDYLDHLDKEIQSCSSLLKLPTPNDSLFNFSKPNNPLDTLGNLKDKLPEDTLSGEATERFNARREDAQNRQDSLSSVKDSVLNKYLLVYQKYQEDSLKLAEYKALLETGPETILKDSLASRGSKQLAWISRVKNFQIGQAIVNYNELSLWGLSVKGIDISAEMNGWYTGATLGRAFNNQGMFDPLNKPEFNKNIAGIQFGKVDKVGNKVIASYFYSKDIKEVQANTQNQVFSLDMQKTVKRLTVLLTAAHSEYQVVDARINAGSSLKTKQGKENKAILSNVVYDVGYGAKLSAKWNYIGALYTTIGNPFLRKNYLEKQYDWEQKWLKGRIKSKVFYKKLQTLESELSPEINTTRGAGIQIQSAFSKGVNFFALYSPYELGNNHPDTAFRTFNRTSLITGGISYSKIWKRTMWFSQVILSQSSISGENLPLTQSRQYALENSLSIDGIHDMRFDVSFNRSQPNLDSMNFASVNGQYMRTVKQNLALGGGFKAISYSKQSHLVGAGINLRWVLFKKIQLQSSFGLDQVKNWWGVEGTKLVSTMNVRLGYSW